MTILDEARAWIARDPDPNTRQELQRLVEAEDLDALRARFGGTLRFGTAGLRGLLGAGPNRMNRVTVSLATAGLCAWLKESVQNATRRGICIGRDARPLSDVFERDVIEVATGAGLPVFIFSDVVPTPVLAFAVSKLGAAAGVMITASHNPPGYNGYKVYWENGAQIIPPDDAKIAERIDEAARAGSSARTTAEESRAKGMVQTIDAVRNAYVAAIADEIGNREARAPIRIAYTALHGVAERTLREVFTRAGFDDVQSVPEQAAPDGAFPTVAFPNPEEPGAMDRVLRLAERVGADLVLANDPDGDRVAAATRGADGFELLSGNDVGMLLADDLLRGARPGERPVVLSTVVSSPMLGSIAASHGARWEQTLTGHKWIQNRALDLADEGYTFVFGYEEALGYATSTAVRDKDGISAALRIADITARLKRRGKTLLDARDSLWRKHGVWIDRQVSIRFEGESAQRTMEAAVDRIRENPPRVIGGRAVAKMRDLKRQVEWTPSGGTPIADLAPSNVLIFELEGGHQAMLRPSGTEPKLKFYFYAVGSPAADKGLQSAKASARAVVERMAKDLTRATGC